MVASDSFAEFLREQLEPLGRVTMRRMFGKAGVFARGAASSSTSPSGARRSGFSTTPTSSCGGRGQRWRRLTGSR